MASIEDAQNKRVNMIMEVWYAIHRQTPFNIKVILENEYSYRKNAGKKKNKHNYFSRIPAF